MTKKKVMEFGSIKDPPFKFPPTPILEGEMKVITPVFGLIFESRNVVESKTSKVIINKLS